MLIEALRRARELAAEREELFASPALAPFPATNVTTAQASWPTAAVLEAFLKLDDHDIMGAVKVWAEHAGSGPFLVVQ